MRKGKPKRKRGVGTLGNPYAAILLVPRDVFRRESERVVRAAEAYRYVAVVHAGRVVTTIHAQHTEVQ